MNVLRPAIHSHGVVAFADGLEDGALGVELLALLVVVRDLHVCPALNLTGVGFELAHQHAKQRGFTGAVRPNQADAIAAHHAKRRATNDGPVSE